MSSSWNLKNNLTIDNSKYLNWLDSTGTRNSIIGLDVNSNVNLNSAFGKGDLYINSNNSTGSTFLNFNNNRNVLIASRLGVGITNTSNMNTNLVLPANGLIGTNSSSGFLGLLGSTSTSGSRVIMYGDATESSGGQLNLHASSVSTGSINFFTGEDLQKRMEIQSSGTINLTPDGSSSPAVSINPDACYFENKIVILNSTQSTSTTDGALQVVGGMGVIGDVHVDGTLSISSVTGNLNFNNSQSSTSYSTGAIFLSGGIGITCSQGADSHTSGGAMSVAGGLALGKNAMIGGNVMIFDTTESISSFTGALVSYGGTGLNGQLNIRTNKTSQIRLANIYTGDETSILFSAINNYTTGGSWKIGQNVNSIGTGNFGIINDEITYALFDGINGKIGFYKDIQSTNSITAANINFTGDLYKNGLLYVGSQWSGSGGSQIYFGSSGSVYVGIGTSNPGYNLDVAGDLNFNGSLYKNGSLYVGSQWSGSIGSKIYYGNYVGIGTSNPGYNLDVAGDLNFNGSLYKNGSLYMGSQWSGSTGSKIYYGNYVGIGTTDPTCALDVNGTARIENLIYTNITTSNVYLNTVNLAGISNYYSGTFSAANNVSVASDITGLLFPSATVRSFVATLAISVTQSTGQNYYSQYTIDGIQTNSGWQIFPSAVGDSIDIIFSIDSSTGQLQYVSPNLANWSSTIMNYDIKTITMNVGYTPTIATSANLNITGQISTSNTTESISSSTGALTVSGGMGITKTLSVGGDLVVNGNRLFGAKFNASNNVITNTAITNLIFPSASYRSFSLLMSVSLSASSNLYSQYTINGIQGASGWSIFTDIIGDTIDINFSIDSTSGQMLYTAPTNYTSWTSTLINYHATVLQK
jgi:hypothetical protein